MIFHNHVNVYQTVDHFRRLTPFKEAPQSSISDVLGESVKIELAIPTPLEYLDFDICPSPSGRCYTYPSEEMKVSWDYYSQLSQLNGNNKKMLSATNQPVLHQTWQHGTSHLSGNMKDPWNNQINHGLW